MEGQGHVVKPLSYSQNKMSTMNHNNGFALYAGRPLLHTDKPPHYKQSQDTNILYAKHADFGNVYSKPNDYQVKHAPENAVFHQTALRQTSYTSGTSKMTDIPR